MATKVTPNYDNKAAYLATATRLYKYTKPRSTFSIEIVEDPNDPWFVYSVKTLNKSKTMKSCVMFIRKDIPDWTRHYESAGWVSQSN